MATVGTARVSRNVDLIATGVGLAAGPPPPPGWIGGFRPFFVRLCDCRIVVGAQTGPQRRSAAPGDGVNFFTPPRRTRDSSSEQSFLLSKIITKYVLMFMY